MDASQWPMTDGRTPRGLSLAEARLVINAYRRGEPYELAPGMGTYSGVVELVTRGLRENGYVTGDNPVLTAKGIEVARRLESAGLK